MPKITSWNVNGIKGMCVKYGSLDKVLSHLQSEIICFQETKLVSKSALRSDVCVSEDFFSFFSICGHINCHEKAYSGTATFVRKDIPVLRAQEGLTGIFSTSKEGDDLIVRIDSIEVGLTDVELAALDSEGRCVMTDHGSFVLLNVYAPNAHTANAVTTTPVSAGSTSEDTDIKWEVSFDNDVDDINDRFVFKMKFNYLLSFCVKKLQLQGRKVILVGDLNVNSQRLDHCEANNHDYIEPFGATFNLGSDTSFDADKKHSSNGHFWNFSFESRPQVLWMKNLLSTESIYIATQSQIGSRTLHSNPLLTLFEDYISTPCGMVDTFRHHWPTREDAYTCWNTLTGARKTNFGTRLDYVLVSASLLSSVEFADISPLVMGSDHCPVHCCLHPTLFQFEDKIGFQMRSPPSLCLIYLHSTVQTSISSFVVTTSKQIMAVAQPPGDSTKSASHPALDKAKRSRSTTNKAANPVSVAIMESLFRRKAPAVSASSCGHAITATTSVTHQFASENENVVDKSFYDDEKFNVKSSGGSKRHKVCHDTSFSFTNNMLAATSGSGGVTLAPLPSAVPSATLSSFRSLFTPVKVPRCSGHLEECAVRTVVKAGPNEGRRFYCCPRPLGAAANKEARCDFFQWDERSKPLAKFKAPST